MGIAIAYERYIAIKRPIIHRQSLTSRRFRRRNLLKYIFCVLAWAIILNVPIWFESEIHWKHNPPNNARNLTEGKDMIQDDVWYPTIKATALRTSPSYSFYYVNILTPLSLGVVPLLLLLFLNFAIYRKINLPSELIRHHQHRMSKRRLTKEIDLARILVWIVTIFIVCHSLRLFLDIHEIAVIDQVRECPPSQMFPPWIFILLSISKLLIVVNSSANMIIY